SAARRRVLVTDPGLPADRRGDLPRSHVAGEELDHQPAQAVAGGAGPGAAVLLRRRHGWVPARADVAARVAVPAVADRLGRRLQRPAAPPVRPARVAPAAR